MLSSSTLVSEEWVLWRENASLSREATDEIVDVEWVLRCFVLDFGAVGIDS